MSRLCTASSNMRVGSHACSRIPPAALAINRSSAPRAAMAWLTRYRTAVAGSSPSRSPVRAGVLGRHGHRGLEQRRVHRLGERVVALGRCDVLGGGIGHGDGRCSGPPSRCGRRGHADSRRKAGTIPTVHTKTRTIPMVHTMVGTIPCPAGRPGPRRHGRLRSTSACRDRATAPARSTTPFHDRRTVTAHPSTGLGSDQSPTNSNSNVGVGVLSVRDGRTPNSNVGVGHKGLFSLHAKPTATLELDL